MTVSGDKQIACAKNNLTFTELLQPFSKLNTDVTIKDPEGANHPVPALSVNFQDFKYVSKFILKKAP